MILYFATLATNPKLLDLLDHPNVLTSFVENVTLDRSKCGLVFLDSGAFTAYNTGKPIRLSDYIDYCLSHSHDYDVIAALDVIGDPEGCARNYAEMTGAGVDILPTYHLGDDWRYYHALLDRYDYVAIGGVAFRVAQTGVGPERFMRHLIRCHQLAEANGVKLHGFGITWWALIRDLPWYSIDSSTFNVGARYGALQTFERGSLARRICCAPSAGGMAQARLKLVRYLRRIPYDQPYTVEDLFPVPDTSAAAVARNHFNILAFMYSVSQATQLQQKGKTDVHDH